MRNYIRSELHRNLKRPYFINFTLVLCLLAAFGIAIFVGDFETDMSFAFEFGRFLLTLPVFLITFFVNMVTTEDLSNKTIRNSVAFGIRRRDIVLGKFICQLIMAFLSASLVLVAYFLSAYIVHGPMAATSYYLIDEFLYSFLGALAIWIGSIGLTNFITFKVKTEFARGFYYLFSLIILPKILRLGGYMLKWNDLKLDRILKRLFIYENLNQLIKSPNPKEVYLYSIFLGLVTFLVFLYLSIRVFEKEDL